MPYAFTEHGAVMAANILKSPIAVQVSVIVIRALIMKIISEHVDSISSQKLRICSNLKGCMNMRVRFWMAERSHLNKEKINITLDNL